MKHPLTRRASATALTEQEIRQLLKKDESLRFLNVPNGTLITPSAREFLNMNGISLFFTGEEEKAAEPEPAVAYIGPHGEKLNAKPEELTHLYGNQLTEKDNPVIAFRGKLDKLCAVIMEAQVLGEEKGNLAFVNDMQEILEFVRSLLPAEYKRSPLGEFSLLGWSSKTIREKSHNPEKHFGRKHLLVHYSMGALCIRLNFLRTLAREAELAAVAAFRDTRKDLVEALNRLSSLFYVLMYKYLPKNYSRDGNAGI